MNNKQKFNEILNSILNDKNNENINELTNIIKINMEKVYWDKIYQDMMDGNSYSFNILLTEISNKIKKLVPNNNSFINNYEEGLNKNYLLEKINKQIFGQDDFVILFKYVINIIYKLQSPSDDIKLENFKTEMLDKIDKGFFIHYIKEIFIYLNNHLNQIHEKKRRYMIN